MSISYFKSPFILICLVTILTACSTAPVTQSPPVESREEPVFPAPVSDNAQAIPAPESSASRAGTSLPMESSPPDSPITRSVEAPVNPAVLALLSDAEKYQQQGNIPAAQSRLQRAQRISPRDPQVYYQLAQTHFELEDYRLAEQVALKGLSYAQGDNTQLKRFRKLLRDIRAKSE